MSTVRFYSGTEPLPRLGAAALLSSEPDPFPSEKNTLQVGFLPCELCHGECCRVYTVYITSFDVYRIASAMRLDPVEFIVWYEKGSSNYPSFRLKESEGQLALGKKPGKPACLFLMEGGGDGRCGVNFYKPMVCRTYPMDFAGDGQMILCKGPMCPELKWPPMPLYDYFADMGRRFAREFSLYRTMVDFWNANFAEKGTLKDFLDFTTGEAEKILQRCSW